MAGEPERRINSLHLPSHDELLQYFQLEKARDLDIAHVYPMTHNQRDLFLDSLMYPNSIRNSVGYYLDIPAVLNSELLQTAVEQLTEHFLLLKARGMLCDLSYGDEVYCLVSSAFKQS